MTNEEIEKRAQALVDRIATIPYAAQMPLRGRFLTVEAIREAVAQTLETAARLACSYCFNRLKVEQRGEDWYHPAQSYWPDSRCEAGAIRALKNSLTNEETSQRRDKQEQRSVIAK